MTANEYKSACWALGVSPTIGACDLLGISRATAARYSAGVTQVPEPVEKLLTALMEANGRLVRCVVRE